MANGSYIMRSCEFASGGDSTSFSDTILIGTMGQAVSDTCANAGYILGTGWIETLRFDVTAPKVTACTVASSMPDYFSDSGGVTARVEDTVFFNNAGAGANQVETVTIGATDADTVLFPMLFGQSATPDTVAPFICTYTIAAGVAADTVMTILAQSNSGLVDTQIIHFSRDITPPPSVSLIYPDSGMATGDSHPLFQWLSTADTQSGTKNYTFEISTVSNFASIVESTTLAGSFNHRLNTALTSGSTYYWRVSATDTVSNTNTAFAEIRSLGIDTTLPVIRSFSISGTANDYISPPAPLPSRLGDTVWYNPTGAGAGQVDTILVAVSDENANAIAAYGTDLFVSIQRADTGLNKDSYTLVYQIPANAAEASCTILAQDNAGNYDTAVLLFRPDTNLPTKPTLSAPADSTITNVTTQTFSWTAASDTQAGIKEYRLQVDSTGAFSAPAVDSVVTPATIEAALTLGANDTWFWRVVAVDSVGNRSSSDTRVVLVDTTPPVIGSIVGPADNHDTRVTAVKFAWNAATDTFIGLAGYRLQADTANTFTALVADLPVAPTALGETLVLPANETYYWRLVAFDTAGNRDTSAVRRLIVDTAGPSSPTLTAPSNGTETNALSFTFTWTASTDSLSGLAGYRLQADTLASFAAPYLDSAAAVGVLSGAKSLPANETWYWRVLAVDNAGCTTASSTWTLKTDTTSPIVGTLLLPAADHDTLTTAITFTWSAATDTNLGVAGYRLQIDTSSSFISPPIDSVAGPTTLTGTKTLAANDTWYWRVVACDRAGNTDTTTSRILRIDTAGPSAPALVLPTANAETNAVRIAFTWGAAVDSVSAITSYRLQIDTTNTFLNLVRDSAAGPTVFAGAETLPANETYYWRVLATAASGCTHAAAGRTLRIDTRAQVTLTSPADSATTDTRPIFAWSGIGTETYTWQVSTLSNFATIADSLTTTALTHQPARFDSGSYYWRVIGWDRIGNIDTAAARSFRVDSFINDTTPPAAFTVLLPADSTETSATTIRYSWNATTDTESGMKQYVLEAAKSPAVDTWGAWITPLFTATVDAATTETTLSLPGTDTWYWHVVAWDWAGNKRASDSRIILVDTTAPTAPSLTLPSANAETRVLDITFTWLAATDIFSGPPSYRLQADTAGTFASPYLDSAAAAGVLTGLRTLPANETWHWRVLAVDRAGNATPSDTRILRTDTIPPVPGRLIMPYAGKATNAPGSINFFWNDATDSVTTIANYQLQVDTAGTFTALVVDSAAGASNMINAISLPANDTYYWRILVTNAAGCTAASGSQLLFADTIPPVAGALLAPSDTIETNVNAIAMSWGEGYDTFTGIIEYRIQADTAGAFANIVFDSAAGGRGCTSALATLPVNETYHWRVIVTDSAGNTDTSASRQILIDSTLPTGPGLVGPADATETNATAIAFSWTASTDTMTGIASYRLQADTDGTFTSLYIDSVAVPSVLAGTQTLAANDTYYWRVVAVDSVGNQGISATRSLIIDTRCTVALALPADSAVQDSRPLFSWSGTGVDSYWIQFDTGGGVFTAASIVESSVQTATLYQPAGLDSGAYWWRVIAWDRFTNRDTSEVRYLRIDTGLSDTTYPADFTVIAPESGIETAAASIRFSWNASVDTGSGLTAYLLEAATDTAVSGRGWWTNPLRQVAVSATVTETDMVVPGTNRWYWHVVAIDGVGNRTVSDSRFILVDTTGPTAPGLITPAHMTDTTSSRIVFSWTASTETYTALRFYRLQVDTNGTFLNPVMTNIYDSTTLVDTQDYTVSDTYYWRILAEDRAGCTTASSTWWFRTDFTPPTGLSLTSPDTDAETNAVTVTFRWTDAVDHMSAVTEYKLQVDTAYSGAFTDYIDSTCGLETRGILTLPANCTYYWRAWVKDSAGNATQTDGRKLVIDTICAVTLSSPDTGATQDTSPIFQWSGVSAETYLWQFAAAADFNPTDSVCTTTSIIYQPTQLDSGLWYWRVVAYDRIGNRDTAAGRFIRIDTGLNDTTPPNPFTVTAPANGHETNAVNVGFSWNLTTDSHSGIASYTIEVDTAGTFVSPYATTQVGAVWSNGTVNLSVRSDTYWWRVVARDAAGCSTASDTRYFIADYTPPTAPTLVAPLSAETTASAIRFQWNAATETRTGIASYQIEVSKNAGFGSLVLDLTQYGTGIETTPLHLFETWDTFYWRLRATDRAGNIGDWSTPDSFMRVLTDTTRTPPASAQYLTAIGFETATILLTWDKSPSVNVIQYNVYFDSGAGGTPGTLYQIITRTGDTAYRMITDTLTAGIEYRFKVVAVDTWGLTDSGVMAAAICTNTASNVPRVTIYQIAAGAKLVENARGIQVLAEMSGTAAQLASVTDLTFQYRNVDVGGQPWVNMAAASQVQHNANPISPENALTPFSYYRFVWDANGVAAGFYQVRAYATITSGETGGAVASLVTIQLVLPSDTATEYSAITTDSFLLKPEIYAATQTETIITTNNGDTQSVLLVLPAGSFPNATDTAGVYCQLQVYSGSPNDASLPTSSVQPAGSCFEVNLSNGDTLFATPGTITLTYIDADLDGKIDGTDIRWSTVKVYSWSTGQGWEELTTLSHTTPTAGATTGKLTARVNHFSIFRLVGSGAAANLDGFMVGPNPFRPNDGNAANGQAYTGAVGTGIYFTGLPAQVKVQIYTVTGMKVTEFQSSNSTGQFQWNVQNDRNQDLASGYYIYIVTDLATNQRVTGKIAVIR